MQILCPDYWRRRRLQSNQEVRKCARMIADLWESDNITLDHVAEALQFRAKVE